MPDKLVLRGASSEDATSDSSLSEEGVRQALARLGRGVSRDEGERAPDQGRETHDPFRNTGSSQRRAAPPMHKLKRPAFVQDGDVVVEYAGRDRQSHHDATDQGRSALDALRDEVAKERRARDDAERALHESRVALQTLQTRLAHLELDLNEARSAVRKAQEEAAATAAERQDVVQPPAVAIPEPPAPPAPPAPMALRVRRQQAGLPQAKSQQVRARGSREPQPVKWWLKSKG